MSGAAGPNDFDGPDPSDEEVARGTRIWLTTMLALAGVTAGVLLFLSVQVPM